MLVAVLSFGGVDVNVALNVAGLAAIFVVVFFARRYRENAETLRVAVDASLGASTAWRDERDAEKAKADRLEQDLVFERERNAQLTTELAALKARTDLQPLVTQQSEFHAQTIAALERIAADGEARFALLHQARGNQERFEAAVAGQFAETARLLRELTTQVFELTAVTKNGNGEGKK